MNRILCPLRSNAAWFTAENTKAALERRLKASLMLFDELLVQDGRFTYTEAEHGAFEMLVPPEQLQDRTKIVYHKPGQLVALLAGIEGEDAKPQPIISGEAKISYQVDFYPILHEAGLLSAKFIRWVWFDDLPPQDKQLISHELFRDGRATEVDELFSGTKFLKRKVLEGLYRDAFVAASGGHSFLIDERVASIAQWKSRAAAVRWKTDPRHFILNQIVSLGFPDFGNEPWEDVVEARESATGKDFRQMISRLTDALEEALPDLSTPEEVAELARKLFFNEVVTELRNRRTTVPEAVINLSLNAVPLVLGAVASTAMDVKTMVRQSRSWFSFLK